MFKRQNILILISIIILGIFARFYKINELAVFLADQASDSTAVLNMLRGKLTLLGPITSVGGFFNGPIVYYLMFPFYLLFQADPISGTVFQATLSVATIPLIYLLGKKLCNTTVGLLSAFLFASSPLMIDYSRAAFNTHPSIFFSSLILYVLFSLDEKYSILKNMILGILIGFIFQMHYFTIAFLLLALIFPFTSNKKFISWHYYFFLLSGFILGLSPFLLFELRHDFLNISLLFRYLSQTNKSSSSFINILSIWPDVTGFLLLGNNFILGLLGFLFTMSMSGYVYSKSKVNKRVISVFTLLFTITFLIGFLYRGIMQYHYVVSFHISLIILFATGVYFLLKKSPYLVVGFCLIILWLNVPHWNIHLDKHPLQDGLAISDFKYAAQIIKNDPKKTYNVAMHAQGDNRAMPLRYTLNLLGEKPVHYDDYGGVDELYFLVKKSEPVTNLKMWEYTSFGPSVVDKKWGINQQYFLYKLKKKT